MGGDLAQWHRPIGTLFPPRDDDQFRLDDSQIAAFQENGYVTGIRVLDEEQRLSLLAAIDQVSSPGHPGEQFWYEYNRPDPTGGLLQAISGWRVRPALHDLLWHPAVTTPMKQLLGGPIRLLFDSLFYKTGRPGGSVSWHQDYSYWTYSQPMCHATCWIALDAADLSNGCVQYVPGSHRWGLLPRPRALVGEAEPSLLTALTPELRAVFKPVPAVLDAGYASFHHPLVVHGSGPNTSGRPRRGTTVHVMRDGTRAAVNEPDIDGVPAWLVGGAGPFFPPGMGEQGPQLGGRYFPLL